MSDYYNSNSTRQSRNPPDYYEQQRRIHNRQQQHDQQSQPTHQQGRQEDESVVYVYDEEETGEAYRRMNEEAVYVYDEGEFADTDMRPTSESLVTLHQQLEAQAMMEQHQHVDYGQHHQMDVPSESRGRSKESRRSRSRSRSSRRRSRTRSRSRSRSRSRRRSRSSSRSRSHHRRRKRSYSRSYSRSRSRTRSRSPRRRRRSSRSSEERERQHFRYPRYQAEPHHTIAVKGLPIDCDENMIFTLIQQQGFQPKDVRILRKKDTGQSRGFGFIEYPDVTSAKAWMDHTQGYLVVDERHHAELQYSVDKPGWNAPQASGSGQMQKFGDWICAKCTMNNFKKRDQCFKCGLPRSESDSMQERGFSEIGITPCDTLLFRDLPDQCDDQKVTESLKKVTALEPLCVSMGDSKMFAYVQMRNVNEATQLLTTLTQMTCLRIDGCEVIVSYSKLPLTAILTGQTLTQTAEQINRMQRHLSQHSSPSMAGLKQSQTDAANAAAAVAQNALRKAHVMRHVTNEVLANQLEAMQAAQLAAAGLVVPPTQLIVQTQQRLLAAKAAVEASTLQLGTVHTPFGELPRYPNPDTSLYQFEPKSGYYFDPSTGLYYDGNSRYYFNAETQQWLYWDSRYQTFLPCQQGQQQAAAAAGSAQAPLPLAAVVDPSVAASVLSAEALPAEVGDMEPTKKELDKTEKAKSAKKIAKEMERWAKEQEKRKTTGGKAVAGAAAPGGSGADKPAAPSFSIRSATADTAFNILERTKGGILPFNDDSDPEDPPPMTSAVASSSSSAQRATPSTRRLTESEDDIVDLSKMACLLCRRQFPSRDVLDKHVQLSSLHKQNLEARRGVSSVPREEPSKYQHQPAAVDSLEAALAFASSASASSSNASAASMQYRDRAKERRQKYGHDKKPLGDLEAPSDDLKQKYLSSRAVDDAEAALTVPLDSSNKGSKLLRSMGWSEGQGLGRNNQGIVDPIMADRRVQGAGLGAVGSKVKAGPNATYKESVKAALRDRFYELE